MKTILSAIILSIIALGLLINLVVTDINTTVEKAEDRATERFNSGRNVYCRNGIFSSTKKYVVSKDTGYEIEGDKFVNNSTDYSYSIVFDCSASAN